jgi:hypothetical protein
MVSPIGSTHIRFPSSFSTGSMKCLIVIMASAPLMPAALGSTTASKQFACLSVSLSSSKPASPPQYSLQNHA